MKQMRMSQRWWFGATVAAGIALVRASAVPSAVAAQQPAAPAAGPTAKATAPLDLTGYWVSIVTEDWRWRMITAPKGDYRGVPYNAEGRRLSEAWDLDKDNATGNQCKAFGAAGVMRIPGRLHITWEADNTLKIDTDAGRQTRLVHLISQVRGGGGLVGEALRTQPAQPSVQGYSLGMWQYADDGAPLGGTAIQGGPAPAPRPRMNEKGSLKVVTVALKPGYLRKNGLPYSDTTVLTEYFDRHEDFGAQWFTVTTVVDDPKYLVSPFVTTTHFKQESSGAKWNPTPCETMPPTSNREEQYFTR